jgi:hypothetical protein
MKRPKFKDRYVLAKGYPWAMGVAPLSTEIALAEKPRGFKPIEFKFPKELWNNALPKYRLVLERVKE